MHSHRLQQWRLRDLEERGHLPTTPSGTSPTVSTLHECDSKTFSQRVEGPHAPLRRSHKEGPPLLQPPRCQDTKCVFFVAFVCTSVSADVLFASSAVCGAGSTLTKTPKSPQAPLARVYCPGEGAQAGPRARGHKGPHRAPRACYSIVI
jgi:hypothetical protein